MASWVISAVAYNVSGHAGCSVACTLERPGVVCLIGLLYDTGCYAHLTRPAAHRKQLLCVLLAM